MSVLYIRNNEGNFIPIPTIQGKDGRGISQLKINANGELEVIYTDDTQSVNLGKVVGEKGANGQDYILTEVDKAEIAEMAIALIPTTEGVEY